MRMKHLFLVVHRLMPTGHVNDAQPAHTQAQAAIHLEALIVWPTVDHALAHAINGGRIYRLVQPEVVDATDATHQLVPLPLIKTLQVLDHVPASDPLLLPPAALFRAC